jgi:carbohydrate-selective porin OprB
VARRHKRRTGGPPSSGEEALEVTYRYAVTPWLAIQPNYQQMRNPGGGSAPRTKLIGARVDIAL